MVLEIRSGIYLVLNCQTFKPEGDDLTKEKLEKDILKHSENQNLEKANELLEKYTNRKDTSDKEIEEVVKQALIKAQNSDNP